MYRVSDLKHWLWPCDRPLRQPIYRIDWMDGWMGGMAAKDGDKVRSNTYIHIPSVRIFIHTFCFDGFFSGNEQMIKLGWVALAAEGPHVKMNRCHSPADTSNFCTGFVFAFSIAFGGGRRRTKHILHLQFNGLDE